MSTSIIVDFRLLAAMSQYFASHDDTRYYLRGVNLSAENGTVYAVATDGRTMIIKLMMIEDKALDFNVIIPASFFRIFDLDQSMADDRNAAYADDGSLPGGFPEDHNAMFKLSDKIVSTDFDGIVHTARFIDGKYPNWKKIIPFGKPSDGLAGFDVAKLKQFEDFSNAAGLADDGDAPCYFSENGEGPALVHFADKSVIGVLMPVRSTAVETPKWVMGLAR